MSDEQHDADPRLTELQALVTGALLGALMSPEVASWLAIEVEPVIDPSGHYYVNELQVRGRNSGERLLVRVERVDP